MFRRQARTEAPIFAVAKNNGVAAVYVLATELKRGPTEGASDAPFLFYLNPTTEAAHQIDDGLGANIRPYVGKQEDLDALLEGRPHSESYGPMARHVPFSFGGFHDDDVRLWRETDGHSVKTRWDYEQLQTRLEAYDRKRNKPLQRLKRAVGL